MDPRFCANPACIIKLSVDHVTLTTSAHVRRFCSVECIEPSRLAYEHRLRRFTHLPLADFHRAVDI